MHKDFHKWDDQHQIERDHPINQHVQETDRKPEQKTTDRSDLKGMMNNLPAKTGG